MSPRGPARVLALAALLLGACNEGPTGPNVGTLSIAISGLPAGAAAAVTVEGPAGFSNVLSVSQSLADAPSGRYVITATSVTATEDLFTPTRQADTVLVTRGSTTDLAVSYLLASGSIAFAASGLPDGVVGEASLRGPGGTTRTVAIPGTARGLVPGAWRVEYPRRTAPDGHAYTVPIIDTIVVSASPNSVPRSVEFAIATGAIGATFNGLPAGLIPFGRVFGRFGIVTALSASGVYTGFEPGEYTIVPGAVFDDDILYLASSVTQTLSASLVPRAFTIDYLPRTGRIALAATGLPAVVTASARVTGPGGRDTTIAVGDTLRGLPNGDYRVEGGFVSVDGIVYGSAELPRVIVVGAQTTLATLAYSPSTGYGLSVDAAYAVQAVQRLSGTVPLVAGRDALVRVFATADGPNSLSTSVRVRILNAGATVFETLVPPVSAGVPTSVDESTFQGSWRVTVPGSALQPGAQLEATIDPSESIPDTDRSDNTLTRALDVRTLPTFRARFVPIRFAAGGDAGAVTALNSASYLQRSRDMLPVSAVDVDVRTQYVTNQPRLTTSVGSTWENLLSELEALRVLEASQRFYLGIVPVGYTSGIAGIAYLGTPTSLTWDYLPSGSEVLAHELGHNFDRYHAPCGSPSSLDFSYPHIGGNIGAYGWDARQQRLRAPTDKDIMSYCNDPWVSDYSWQGVLSYRANNEPLAIAPASSQAVLLVRGQITPDGVELEPTFTVSTVPVLPTPGPHRLEMRDAAGAVIYAASFRGKSVQHARRDGTEHFTFAIPASVLGGRSVASMSVTAASGRAEVRGPAGTAARSNASLSVTRRSDGGVRVSDSDASTRGLIIRDAATGRVISIVSGREAILPSGLGELDVLRSDGVRSRSLRIRPPIR